MALFYLIRHGELVYDHMLENGFWGFGRDFAPLPEKGMEQAETVARDILKASIHRTKNVDGNPLAI